MEGLLNHRVVFSCFDYLVRKLYITLLLVMVFSACFPIFGAIINWPAFCRLLVVTSVLLALCIYLKVNNHLIEQRPSIVYYCYIILLTIVITMVPNIVDRKLAADVEPGLLLIIIASIVPTWTV